MICYHCGKRIDGDARTLKVDTYTVNLHPNCRRWYKTKPETATAQEDRWQSVDGNDEPE